jgi:hypothetical protein
MWIIISLTYLEEDYMKNVGKLDARIRYGISAVMVLLGVFIGPASSVSIGLYIAAGVLSITGAVGFCGLYKVLGIRTCPLEKK